MDGSGEGNSPQLQARTPHSETMGRVSEAETHLGHSVQDTGHLGHPVVDLAPPPTGVEVGQEGGEHREVGGEAVVHVLLLHGQVLG